MIGLVIFVVILLLALPFIWDAIVGLRRKWNRRRIFALAQQHAEETGKPLLVVGDPANGFGSRLTGTDYSYGDACLDLNGCPGAPSETMRIKSKLEEYLPQLNDNCCVLFISCVLEYIDVLDDQLVAELNRVSGNDLFVVTVEPYTLTSLFYYGKFFTGEGNCGRRAILTAPPDDETLTWRDYKECH